MSSSLLTSLYKQLQQHFSLSKSPPPQEPISLDSFYFKIRLGIWVVTFTSTIVSFFVEKWPSTAIFIMFPVLYLVLLYFILTKKNTYLIALPHLIMLLLATVIVLQEGSYYLRMLTSCLGFIAIYSVQSHPVIMQLCLAGGYLFFQKHFRYHMSNVYEPITDTYRISAPAVDDALDGWAASLILEILSLLAYQTIVNKIWKNYQDAKVDLEKTNIKLVETNNILANTVEKLDRLNKELEQALESQGLFVACVSHELRNPLNVLLGNIDMLESEIKDQHLSKLLRTCKVCGEILLGHINNLLDVAKINANKIEINESLTKTTGLVERIWTLAKVGLEKKGLIGHLAVDMKMPLWLNVDAERLHQILDNLLGNAIKFTTTGSVRISFKWLQEGSEVCSSGALESTRVEQERNNKSVHLESMMDIDEEKESLVLTKLSTNMKSMKNLHDFLSFSNGQSVLESLERTLHKGPWEQSAILKIEIIDTGCGITEDAQKKLFMPFVQADRSITRHYGGTGLGLYIAKMLVEKMGGTLKLSSRKDIGTRFEIVLPMKPVKEIDQNQNQQQQVTVYNRNNNSKLESLRHLSEGLLTLEEDLVRENAGKRESKKVLVVDDDMSNQFVLDSFLKKLGYEGDMANNGREAVEMFRKKPSDYLFIAMDIQMPGMDGITAAKEIRKFETARKMKKIPIVFVTGNCSEDEQMECLTSDKIGCSYFFRKPFRYNDCKACIERIKSSSKIL